MLRVAACALLATAGLAPSLAAQQAYEYESYTLPNGLTVILSEDHSSAVAEVNIWFRVGSRDEVRGRTGFAHLFEHMMFQGSANVAKGEFNKLLEGVGGINNGTTNEDRTAYFESLPSNHLTLALWLEADRMRSLAVTDENFENQREVVKEERRMRVENQPYMLGFMDLFAAPYDSATCFGYAHNPIGSMDDLNAAETADVQAFFRQYYAPNNAILTIVGDFEMAEIKALIEDYFGDIPRGDEPPPPPACDVTYGSFGQRRTIPDRLANLPAVLVAFLIPPHNDADSPAISLLSSIVGSGESSRINRALVRDGKVALQASMGVDSRLEHGVLYVITIANQGVPADQLETHLFDEIARVRDEGVAAEELEKAKNLMRSGMIFGRQTAAGMASSLQHYALYHDSIDEINTDIEAYLAVTLDDIQRVAKTYLTRENAVTLIIVPDTGEEGGTP
jgi:predicted Zn-dependent peptidase